MKQEYMVLLSKEEPNKWTAQFMGGFPGMKKGKGENAKEAFNDLLLAYEMDRVESEE